MKKVIYLFFIWRLALFLIASASPLIIPRFGATFPYYQERLVSSGLPHFVWSFGNFDGVHYLGIAKDAYSYQYTQAFFPLYPILVKLFSYITFGNLIISALLISNAAFLSGLLLFYKLISRTQNEKVALWSCIFILTFPTSFYFGAIYTEGLFFLMIISSFLLIHHKKIWQAATVGTFASATRLIGLFLTPLLISRQKLKTYLYASLVPLGFFAYVLYLKIKFNNPLYFLSAQSIFGQERSTTSIVLLPQVIFRYLKIIATTQDLILIIAIFELLFTLAALAALTIAFVRVNRSWALFSALAILLPTLTGTLASMPRYVLVAFPIYVVLAQIKSFRIKVIIAAVMSLLLVFFTTLFAQGYWVA